LLTTNSQIIHPSQERPIILRIQSQDKLREGNWESIHRVRKAEHLSTHGGSEEEVVLEERRQMHLGAPLRNQQSP